MIDKETWKIGTDRGKMEKLIKYNKPGQYHKKKASSEEKKTFSNNVKQSTIFFYEW